MVGWHHLLNGHEFEQAPGDSEGQGSLMCCGPWGCKESDMTERLTHTRAIYKKLTSNTVTWQVRSKGIEQYMPCKHQSEETKP